MEGWKQLFNQTIGEKIFDIITFRKNNNKINYFSLVGWMKYIASMEGNGCLRLCMSSTTAGKK